MGHLTIEDTYLDLGLQAVELLVYSVIAGFSQKDEKGNQGAFYGTRAYLAKWTGGRSKRTVDLALAKLTEKGLIEKKTIMVGNEPKTAYTIPERKDDDTQCRNCTGAETAHPQCRNCTTPGAETAPINNIEYNIDDIIVPTTAESADERIERKRMEFQRTLEPFKDRYPARMLEAFFDWWAEPLQHPTKSQVKEGIMLRYQTQLTWSLSGRLATWQRRDQERKAKGPGSGSYGPRVNDRGETATVASMRAANESMRRAAELQEAMENEHKMLER